MPISPNLLKSSPAPSVKSLKPLLLFLGLVARLTFRRAPARAELMLGAHAFAGVAGLLVFLSWASRLP